MKVQRPVIEDISDAFKFVQAMEQVSQGYNPFTPADDSEEEPEFYSDNHKAEILDGLITLFDGCDLEFLLLALSAIIAEQSGIVDFESDDLELSKRLKQGLADTERLDWLVKNDCALTERLCDEDGDRLDTPFAVIQKQEEHFEVLAAACDIREAIDAAMRYCTPETQPEAV